MKHILRITFLLALLSNSLTAQTHENLEDHVLNSFYRSHDSLPKITYLDSLATVIKKRKKFNHIYGCLSMIDSYANDSKTISNIHQRLKDLSRKLCSENKFFVLIGGSNCWSSSEEKNINEKLVTVHYVCVSGCVSSFPYGEAVEVFNNETRRFLSWKEKE
ncbi:hypothetical protein NAT51_14075 [Flavobacterium amniphilum]|uniref:hypothetical protein n=1 Tax=Flavobacterium amniphilum TaxID=1834035 RepID=UPI00202A9214|nr:hypothetical protein [Flavobacterium amniphilum]MCL9806659.1 hypothetical protein [Flavobacterium amniphilum]